MKEKKTTVFIPGGYKPPHGGHYNLIKWYSELEFVDEVYVYVSKKKREEIGIMESISIFNVFSFNHKVKIKIAETNSAMRDAYEYILNLPEDCDEHFAMGSSNKSEKDNNRSIDFRKNIEKYKIQPSKDGRFAPSDIFICNIPCKESVLYRGRNDEYDGKPISATVLRQDIKNENFELFKTNYKDLSDNQLRDIYNILV